MAVVWSNPGGFPSRSMEPPEEKPIPREKGENDFADAWNQYRQRAMKYDVTLPDAYTVADKCRKETDLGEDDGDYAARAWLIEEVVDYILG